MVDKIKIIFRNLPFTYEKFNRNVLTCSPWLVWGIPEWHSSMPHTAYQCMPLHLLCTKNMPQLEIYHIICDALKYTIVIFVCNINHSDISMQY